MIMTGFLDGINDSLVEPNDLETMTEDTEVNLVFVIAKLAVIIKKVSLISATDILSTMLSIAMKMDTI